MDLYFGVLYTQALVVGLSCYSPDKCGPIRLIIDSDTESEPEVLREWWRREKSLPLSRPEHLLFILTHCVEQSPTWEPNRFSATQEIPRILGNPKVHYRTHKRPPPVSILSQPNPVHIPTFHLLEINSNIIHPSTPRSPQWSRSLRFPHQDPIHPLSSPILATCTTHLILLHFITRTIFGEQYKSVSSSLCSFLHSPDTSPLLGPNFPLNTLFSNTLKLRSSLNVSDQVSHPYKTKGRIIILYIFVFKFLHLLSI